MKKLILLFIVFSFPITYAQALTLKQQLTEQCRTALTAIEREANPGINPNSHITPAYIRMSLQYNNACSSSEINRIFTSGYADTVVNCDPTHEQCIPPPTPQQLESLNEEQIRRLAPQ